ncbi:MAG: HEAT repeat domain-containing protein [Phycisphaerae bacterium]|nr:HEAT repeat domain-containing protein [Phycisphaerae bacterium]
MTHQTLTTVKVVIALLAVTAVATRASGQDGSNDKTIDPPARVKLLLEAIESDDADLRTVAIKALGKMKGGHGLDALIALAANGDDKLRYEAMSALADIGDRRCFDEFMGALADPYDAVRMAAVRGLCALGDPRAAGALADMLVVVGSNRTSREQQRPMEEALLRMEEAAIPHLTAMLRKDSLRRTKAGQLLGRMRTPQATKALTQAMQDRRWRVRATALRSLATASPRPWEVMISALADTNSAVQLSAVQAVASLIRARGPSGLTPTQQQALRAKAIAALARVLTDDSSSIRLQAAQALNGIRDKGLVAPLCTLLTKGNPAERREAMKALAYIADESATAALVRASADNDRSVRLWAQDLLVRIGGAGALPGLVRAGKEHQGIRSSREIVNAIARIKTPESVQSLFELAREAPEETQRDAMRALCQARHAKAASLFADLARTHKSARIRKEAVSLLGYQFMRPDTHALCTKVFTAAMQDSDADVRIVAARLSARLPDEAGLKICVKALKDPDTDVRVVAAHALVELDTNEGRRALRDAVADESDRRVLAAISRGFQNRPKASQYDVEGLLAVLRRELALGKGSPTDRGGRSSVITPLGYTGNRQAMEIFRKILTTDPSDQWRDQAAKALAGRKERANVEALIKALGDESLTVRETAAWTLSGVADKEAVKSLLVATRNPRARKHAARVLAVVDPKAAFKPYLADLKSDPQDHGAGELATEIVRSARTDIVEALIVAMERGAPHVRVLAARRLCLTFSTDALESLRKAMTAEDQNLRYAAGSAVKTIERHHAPKRVRR